MPKSDNFKATTCDFDLRPPPRDLKLSALLHHLDRFATMRPETPKALPTWSRASPLIASGTFSGTDFHGATRARA